MSTFEHDPNATLDYHVDWTIWLASGETISTSSWVVPSGLTSSSPSATGTRATVWLSGGTAEALYTVTNRIVTTANRTEDRSFILHCKEK